MLGLKSIYSKNKTVKHLLKQSAVQSYPPNQFNLVASPDSCSLLINTKAHYNYSTYCTCIQLNCSLLYDELKYQHSFKNLMKILYESFVFKI